MDAGAAWERRARLLVLPRFTINFNSDLTSTSFNDHQSPSHVRRCHRIGLLNSGKPDWNVQGVMSQWIYARV